MPMAFRIPACSCGGRAAASSAPGVVVTEENAQFMSGSRAQKQIDTVPLGRLGTPDDIGPLCVYLAADESAWISGTVIQVTGGSRVPIGYMAYLHKVNKARRESPRATTLVP